MHIIFSVLYTIYTYKSSLCHKISQFYSQLTNPVFPKPPLQDSNAGTARRATRATESTAVTRAVIWPASPAPSASDVTVHPSAGPALPASWVTGYVYTVKKGYCSSPISSRDVHITKLSLAENNLIIPGQCNIPAGDKKNANLVICYFYGFCFVSYSLFCTPQSCDKILFKYFYG